MKWTDKFKKINFKSLIKAFTFIWGVILIFVMTITSIGFSDEFNLIDWIANSLIILGIIIFGLFMGESIGKDKQETRPNGLYQVALKTYNEFRKKIDDLIIYFSQWFRWYKSKESVEVKIDYLIDRDMPQEKAENIVKYCVLSDFEPLKTRPIIKTDKNGNQITIRKLETFEIDPVHDVLSGKVKEESYSCSYYLSAFGKGGKVRSLQVAPQIDKEIRFNKIGNRVIRIIFSVVISFVFAAFTVKDFAKGNDPQAWLNLVSRFSALFTGLFSGWLSSVIDVKLRAEKLEDKTNILNTFYLHITRKEFIPKTENELAKEEYEKYLHDIEESKKEVVDVEIPETDITVEVKEEPLMIEAKI